MKQRILMICSWLDVEKKTGLFFWEQAGFIKDDFDFILCRFQKKHISRKNLFRAGIVKQTTPNGIEAYLVDYLYNRYFPVKLNEYLHRFYIRRFYKFLKDSNIKIDLIHAQSVFNAAVDASYMNERYGIPFVFTEHNQFSLRGKTPIELNSLKNILKSNYPKLAVSFDKVRQFAANGLFADFEVVGNGVDEKLFYYKAPDTQFQSEDKELSLITVGAYSPVKDQETIFKALDFIDEKLKKEVQFTWIGFDCWGVGKEKEVRKLVNRYPLKNIKVRLVPLMHREEVAMALQESDLFLFSSISEGMPVSVLEALSCGLPVCTTRCGGVDELINAGNGQIVQIKDYRAIGRFMIKFINKDFNYDREKISRTILKYYGSSSFGARMKRIYLGAINNSYKIPQ